MLLRAGGRGPIFQPCWRPSPATLPRTGAGAGAASVTKRHLWVGVAEGGGQKLCTRRFGVQARKGLDCSAHLVCLGFRMFFGAMQAGRVKAWFFPPGTERVFPLSGMPRPCQGFHCPLATPVASFTTHSLCTSHRRWREGSGSRRVPLVRPPRAQGCWGEAPGAGSVPLMNCLSIP